jgi:hypothetical protein
MDVAMHDMQKDVLYSSSLLISPSYLKKFWVGLLEGDGFITVDQLNKKRVRVRIAISMKNTPSNMYMMKLIQTVMKGRVAIERNRQYVIWIASSKRDVEYCLNVLEEYPLITLRKQLQQKFALECLKNPSFYILNRDLKYNPPLILPSFPTNLPYFPSWLSGFVEAEGHFRVRLYPNGRIQSLGFAIGQNEGLELLKIIKDYFNSHHTITKDINKNNNKYDHYRISITGPKCNLNLLNHFNSNPLLGEKKNQYDIWRTAVKRRLNI